VHQDSVSSIKTIRFQLRTVPEFVNIKKNCTHSMKLLVVDDHLLFREGLRHILLRLDQTVDIHECGTVQEAVAVANHISKFDLVLLDMQLPGLQGLEGLLALKGAFPTSPITLISGVADQRAIAEGIRCGAQGFVSKSGSAEEMLNGLRKVINGEHHIPPRNQQFARRWHPASLWFTSRSVQPNCEPCCRTCSVAREEQVHPG
jgi:DNA-binding NarL/FixJ family response regulator